MNLLCRLHANVFARPENASPGPAVPLRGQQLATLIDPEGGPPRFLAPMPTSFETIQSALLELGADCEPDGFFLLSGRAGEAVWRLNGHMHEYRGRMHRVELNGECPPETLDAVLATLGADGAPLVFELVQEGVTLASAEFIEWAVAAGGPCSP